MYSDLAPWFHLLTHPSDYGDEAAFVSRVVDDVGDGDGESHTLLELGLLKRERGGKIVQSEPLVSTGPEVQSLNVANYHRMMMQRAADAIDAVAPDERDISSLTLCLGADGARRLKERIQRFRRELLELSTMEENPRQVVQINFQLFPLSRE